MSARIQRDFGATSAVDQPPSALAEYSGGDVDATPDRIKVLFIAVNGAQAELRLDEEHRAIRKSLERWPERFAFYSLLGVRSYELGEELRRRSPDVLHFCGHGASPGGLAFPDAPGKFSPISADAFSALLRALRGNIQLVVLNACFSEQQARAVSNVAGIAIGMRRQISDEAAVAFSRALYSALADAKSVGDAFEMARAGIRIAGKPEDADVPVLHRRRDVDPSRVHLPGLAPAGGLPRPGGGIWLGTLARPAVLIAIASLIGLATAQVIGARRPIADGGGEFTIKVRLVDEAGRPVKLTGRTRLESDAYTPTVLVDNSDLVEFPQVPGRLEGSNASFAVDSQTFRVASPLKRYRLRINGLIDLELQPIVSKVSGTVSVAGKRLSGGQISLAGYGCSGAIADGYFEVPCANVKLPVNARVSEPDGHAMGACNREVVLEQVTNNELELGACSNSGGSPPVEPPKVQRQPPPPPVACVRSANELIRREAELVMRQDLNGVVGLFAPGATVRDAHTGVRQSPRDRYLAELTEHRFVTASHDDIQCVPSDATIWLCTSSSAGVFDHDPPYNNPPGSDQWVLERQGRCWRIRSLAINAAGTPFGA